MIEFVFSKNCVKDLKQWLNKLERGTLPGFQVKHMAIPCCNPMSSAVSWSSFRRRTISTRSLMLLWMDSNLYKATLFCIPNSAESSMLISRLLSMLYALVSSFPPAQGSVLTGTIIIAMARILSVS